MQQELLMFCEGAEAANGKLYVLGGGVDRHYVAEGAQPPIQLKGDIAVSFLVDWHETNDRHAMTIKIKDQDDNQVVQVDGEFVVGRPPGAKLGQELRQIISIRGPFPLPATGAYKIVLELDGIEQSPPFRFWVEQMEPGGMVRP